MVTHAWASDPEHFDTEYFKRVVAKAILTKAVDAAIPAQPWYPGSIVRPLTSYTLALISARADAAGLQPNYDSIWRAQKAPLEFMEEAMHIAKLVLPLVLEIPEEQVRNRLVTEWVKREACWTRIIDSKINLSDRLKESFILKPASKRGGASWSDRAHGLWRQGDWKRLLEWNRSTSILSPDEADIVERAAITSQFSFNGFRLTKLEEAWKRAVDFGFV